MFSQLSDKLQDIFKDLRGHGTISETNISDALREVRMALLEADVDYQVAKDFIARVKEKALGEDVLRSVTPGQQIVKIFHGELTNLLGGDAAPLVIEKGTRILIVGLNGAGKTTSAAKVAKHCHEALDVTGIVLTKLDGDARGGAALSMREVTKRPIKFVGVGEKLDQFEPCFPERLAGRILGMGDVLSLVEKAAAAIDEE